MDPITAVGFIAAVVQLIDVTSKVVSYFNDVKDAPKDRAKLAREATGLLALFTDLRYRVEETNSNDPWFTGLRSLGAHGGPLTEFQTAMEEIANKLAPASGVVNLKRVLRWTLDKKEMDTILSKIERLKTLVGLTLQKDHFQLSLAMKKDIAEMKANRNVDNLIKWLAPPLPSSNHNTAIKKKQPRTGEWFTQSEDFADWKTGTSSFMWLHGIPGCGKTILCSTIIQDVISSCYSQPQTGVSYFYFDFNDLSKRKSEMLIRSLIVQFAAQCPFLPHSLQSALESSQNQQKQPTSEELKDILFQILKSFRTIYVLLDALDECIDREDLLKFMESLLGWKMSGLHILTTSRKENDIATSFESLVTCQLCVQSALVDADIRIHVLDRLSNDPKLKKWPVNIQKEIEDALVKGANGMFRWAACQLDSLRKCLRLEPLRKALETLPKTLDLTYEQILSNLDEEYEDDAMKVLQWLCFSLRPMRLNEMVEVLAIDLTSDSGFDPEQRLPDPYDIITICSSLVSVTRAATEDTQATGTEELRLAHFSVKEYLISDRLKKSSMHRYHIASSPANISIVKSCLTYLHHFKSPIISMSKFCREFPLSEYAAEYWPRHYKSITVDADREELDFLGYNLVDSKNSCFINWLNIFDPDRRYRRWRLENNKSGIQSSLYCMSLLGISGIVRLLLNKEANVHAEGGIFGNALSAASCYGHKEVVQLLLEKGANFNAEDGYLGNALSAASSYGHEEVVQLLLENGANVNAEGGRYGSALSAASGGGYEEMVRLLLENGANVNAKGGRYGSALSAASYKGHEKVVRLLLENGANVNAKGGVDGNALSAASNGGYEEMVRLLLENGANVNAEGGRYGPALSAASGGGYEEVVQLLLENGANVNSKGGSYGNALSAASYKGHEKVVRLLVENGANVNAKGGVDGNALSAASGGGYEEVVQLLLENGANVNVEGGRYGRALSAALIRGHVEVMRLLLKYNADVSLVFREDSNGKALQGISADDHEAVIQLLLKRGSSTQGQSNDSTGGADTDSRHRDLKT